MHRRQKRARIVENIFRERYGIECIIEEQGDSATVAAYGLGSSEALNGMLGEFAKALCAAGEYESVTLLSGEMSAPLRGKHPELKHLATYTGLQYF